MPTIPYFGLLGLYNAAGKPPFLRLLRLFPGHDALRRRRGKARTVTAYFDGTPDSTAGSMIEFVIAAGAAAGKTDAGRQPRSALGGRRPADERRSAIRRLGPVDRHVRLHAPGGRQQKSCGLAACPVGRRSAPAQSGRRGHDREFRHQRRRRLAERPASAAEVGTDQSKLPSMGADAVRAEGATTAYNSSSPTGAYKQDGYAEAR